MRVLFLGHCSYYTVSNLARAIKQGDNEVIISAADLIMPGGGNFPDEESPFKEVINLPRKKSITFNNTDRLRGSAEILKDKKRRRILLKLLLLLRIKSVVKFVNTNTQEKIYSDKMKEILSNYDLFHFHYVSPEFLVPLKYIEKEKKVILTIWGSDLMQVTGTKNYKIQSEAFQRADCITINTIELREIFLSKFGRELFPKIRQAYFPLNTSKIRKIQNHQNVNSGNFRNKNDIPKNKKTITIGYSAASKQRHVEILEILSRMDSALKEKIHIVIPMTFGLQFEKKDYLNNVFTAAEKTGIGFSVLQEYLKGDDLTEFVSETDIFLNLRESDALNASLIEFLCAGTVVVNGAWLPYGKLKRLGVNYLEIEELEELTELIPGVVENFLQEKEKTKLNSKILLQFYENKNIGKDWIKIYKEFSNMKDNKLIN